MDEELIRRIVREELDKRGAKKKAINGAHNFKLSPISKNIIYQEDGSIVIDMNKAI